MFIAEIEMLMERLFTVWLHNKWIKNIILNSNSINNDILVSLKMIVMTTTVRYYCLKYIYLVLN